MGLIKNEVEKTKVLFKQKVDEVCLDLEGKTPTEIYSFLEKNPSQAFDNKIVLVEIHADFPDLNEYLPVGLCLQGTRKSTHQDALLEAQERVVKILSKSCLGFAEGGCSLKLKVEKDETNIEHLLILSGYSNRYGPIKDQHYEEFVHPALRRYLDSAELNGVKIIDQRVRTMF